MNNFQEIQKEIFVEIKKYLNDLSQIESRDEFLLNIDKITKIHEKALFLKVFDEIDFSEFQNNESPLLAKINEESLAQHPFEKKFKLAHIKSLKHEEDLYNQQNEEEHPKIAIRLDLNDKIAFLKFLFNDNQEAFSITLEKLNACNNREDAKNYLSEIYHKNNWKKVDEYAQRLWDLVEKKFNRL